jgi:hypothetical protein
MSISRMLPSPTSRSRVGPEPQSPSSVTARLPWVTSNKDSRLTRAIYDAAEERATVLCERIKELERQNNLLRAGILEENEPSTYEFNAQLGWIRWRVCARKRAALFGRAKCAAAHMLHRQLARGLTGWRAIYTDRLRKQRAMQQGLRYLLNRNLARGWRGWHGTWTERQRKLLAMKRAAVSFTKRGMANGWRAWHAKWAERQRKLQAMERAAVSFLTRNLGKGWRAWWGKWDTHRRQLECMRRALLTFVKRNMVKG